MHPLSDPEPRLLSDPGPHSSTIQDSVRKSASFHKLEDRIPFIKLKNVGLCFSQMIQSRVLSKGKSRVLPMNQSCVSITNESRVPITNSVQPEFILYHSWSRLNEMTKDCVFTNSQGLRLWKLSSSKQQRVCLILKDKERIKTRQEFDYFYHFSIK